MARFLIIISPSTAEQPYILDISTSGDDNGAIVRHKPYDAENLRQDMKNYLEVSDEGFVIVLKAISEKGRWEMEASLSDSSAAHLGWFE